MSCHSAKQLITLKRRVSRVCKYNIRIRPQTAVTLTLMTHGKHRRENVKNEVKGVDDPLQGSPEIITNRPCMTAMFRGNNRSNKKSKYLNRKWKYEKAY